MEVGKGWVGWYFFPDGEGGFLYTVHVGRGWYSRLPIQYAVCTVWGGEGEGVVEVKGGIVLGVFFSLRVNMNLWPR